MSVRVLVIDDHLIFAELLVDALCRAGYDAVAADLVAHDDDELVIAADGAAVVVLDMTLGPGRRGLPLIERFVGAGCAVIVLTGDDDSSARAAARSAGAVEVLDKLLPLDDVLVVIERVAPAGDPSSIAMLTPREQEVLACLVAGQSAKEIATTLGVALPTVRTQLRSVYRKLDVPNARAAVVLAVRTGWVPSH